MRLSREEDRSKTEVKLHRGVFFSWFSDTLFRGFEKKDLSLDDIPSLPSYLTSQQCKARFQAQNKGAIKHGDTCDWLNMDGRGPFRKRKEGSPLTVRVNSWPLIRAIVRCHYDSMLKITILKAAGCALSFAGPLLLGQMVLYLEHGIRRDNLDRGFVLIMLLGAVSFFTVVINSNSNARSMELKMEITATLTQVVFARALSLPACAWNDLDFSEAQINNFAQIDVDKVASCIQNINDLWLLPAQILIAFALLYLQIKVAFVAGVVVILFMIPINSMITKAIGKASEGVMNCKDARVKIVTEALKNIASVKMSGLEEVVLATSAVFRNGEIKYLARRKYLDSLCVFLWATTPILVPFATFATTVMLPGGSELSSAQVITTIALLNMLIFPMNAFPWVINGFMEARVSVRRIGKLLNDAKNNQLVIPEFSRISEEKETERQRLPSSTNVMLSSQLEDSPNTVVLLQKNNRYSWKVDDSTNHTEVNRAVNNFTLQLANDLVCKHGELWAIAGATGSGKSSLLLSILQELRCEGINTDDAQLARSSSVEFRTSNITQDAIQLLGQEEFHEVPSASLRQQDRGLYCNISGGVAYCSQTPIIFSGSVRSNIIMGTKFHEARYNSIIDGCGLLHDMKQGTWPEGDMTDVGSMGSNLSGGQRLRIGVARAIYANCKTILLDDPTSALDPHTTDQLFRYLAEVVVKQEKRLVVLTSHNIIALVRACDLAHQQLQGILVLHEGNELARGSYHSLISQCSLISELLHQQVDQQSFKNEVESTVSANLAEGLGEDNSKSLVKDAIETKLSGKIDRAVYWDYVCSLGIGNSFVTIFATVSMQVTSIMLSLFFGYWATHMDDFTTSQFLYISSSIVAANILCAIVRSFLFAFASLRSCQLLYNQLGQSVFNTYLAFFDRAPIGTVINRFGKDTNTIDDSLPFILNILLAQTVLLLGSVMVMIYTNPMILLLVAIVSYLYYHLQSFYRETSRELRRLESVYRSPIYTLFSESISGAVVLRALYSSAKWHAGHRSASMDMVTRNSWNVLEDPLVANNDTTESRAYSVDFYLQHHNILMHCMRNLSVALDRSLQVSFAVGVSSQWLGVRMQLLGMLITTCLALSIFLNNYYNVYPISAGIAGLSLIYSYNIVNNLNGFINALAETEQEMVSVERVLEFTKTLSSEYENIASPHNSQSQFTSSTQWFWNWTFTSLATNGYRSLSRDSTGASIRFDDILHSSTDDDVVVSLLHSNHETLLNIDSGESRKLEDDVEAAPLQVSPEFRSVYVLFSEKVGIKIKHLNLRYQNIESAVMKTQNTTSKIALDDISLDISPGSRVLIVGRTGSGKTSLLRTLLRLYEYDYSHIEFGMPQSQVFQLGIRGELNQISKKQLRRRVGVVPQTPVLFSESLRFNVDPYSEFTDEEIWQALQQSNFLQTLNVNEMNGSYTIHDSVSKVQTVVSCSDILNLRLNASDGNDAGNNSGCNLSHGQKQLLCLCRALLRQSDLLLIDELSAALDANTRACAYMAIRSYMDRIPSGILLMISHQMEGINSICNKMLKLQDGKVVAYTCISNEVTL